ncbi:MAG: class A beta-lactamase [Sphingomonas sp.]
MAVTVDRRLVLGGALALGLAGRLPAAAPVPDLDAIARAAGGRLGVAALDTGSGRRLAHDADRRFALCSTFKVVLAAAILAQVDAGRIALAQPLGFTDADILSYAPVVQRHRSTHRLTVAEACAAAVQWSDNSAANLLLARIGGQAALTRFIRAAGDPVTRLDRNEPSLNIVPPGDLRDTTTPAAMVGLLHALLLGEVLRPASRRILLGWMDGCQTGKEKLRAGLPADWQVGDKTGNSGHGAVNDVAIARPPGRAPILVACYLDAPKLDGEGADRIHAAVGRAVGAAFA